MDGLIKERRFERTRSQHLKALDTGAQAVMNQVPEDPAKVFLWRE